ncbi:hypothetical protein EPA93_36450 [Ktedonosporobacter rubrisoli]|uniref:DUF1579 domain-containing protein n=1 Tax=Ktedonosporobacter rubrisoli TaxID=2509675 RepID=A0A4P6K061_KTERU|nr:hypothetical protein [Ktedonosporobacter rubrisoli]QBD81173.1 hypothetical protein EPA93_36450 [Ktedonosporobacter rubrisoli]
MSEHTSSSATSQPAEDLKRLEKLVGTWALSADTSGQVTYEWLEGGFFLLQRVDMLHAGHRIQGLEVIGHLRPFGEEPSADIISRFYGSSGETLDYVYELTGNTLMIWAGEKGSPAYYKGTFSEDGNVCVGAWEFPGGGGYSSTMTRVRRQED